MQIKNAIIFSIFFLFVRADARTPTSRPAPAQAAPDRRLRYVQLLVVQLFFSLLYHPHPPSWAPEHAGVGKTCLIMRFADDNFSASFTSTIGYAYIAPWCGVVRALTELPPGSISSSSQ
jgi:hypothetical protein